MDKNKSKLPAPRVYKSEQEARAGLLSEHPDCTIKVVATFDLFAHAIDRQVPGAREKALALTASGAIKILAATPIPEFAGMDPAEVRALRAKMGA